MAVDSAMHLSRLGLAGLALPLLALTARAQENYEIQVYPSKTADPKTTLFELHSNFTGSGTLARAPDEATACSASCKRVFGSLSSTALGNCASLGVKIRAMTVSAAENPPSR